METVRPEHLVLVAVLPRPRDLQIARVLGWYRIPLGSAPKTVRVDWIAFYQPGSFGEDRWQVRYLAPVEGHELVRRVELLSDEPDHPRAEEPYYKLQLGKLRQLEHPIPADGWRRFTFLFTTGRRLLAAHNLKELTVTSSAEHDSLWRMLRERTGA